MPGQWAGTHRRNQLPPNWPTLRQHTLAQAGYRCQATLTNGDRCPQPATDADHITPGNNHHHTNLQALCHWHHQRKTTKEAQQAKQNKQRNTNNHPGLKPQQ